MASLSKLLVFGVCGGLLGTAVALGFHYLAWVSWGPWPGTSVASALSFMAGWVFAQGGFMLGLVVADR